MVATDDEGNPTGDTKIDISGSESGTAVLQCALMLRRTDAKIEVCLRAEAADEKWTDFVFVPGTWRVHKVPRQSLILPDTTPADAVGEYFSTNATEFETSTEGVHGFVFYMPENLKTPEKRISVNDSPTEEEEATAYALREKWITEDYDNPAKPGQSERNVKFEYADENSTYLEITGELSYNREDGSPVQATTRYYVHLGYADEDPNDYLTQRNHHYTYNITVKGVDKIILEVTQGSDLRPGHEGDVIASKHSIYELDSHYDRCTVDIAPADIVAEGETQTTWSVSTPFCDGGVYDPVSGSFSGVEDYRWIKFAINELHGAGYGEFVKWEHNGDSWQFDLSKLSSQALRSYYVEGAGTYPANDEKDEDNLPYVRFEVSGKLYLEPDRTWEGGLFDGEYVWNERDWNWFQTNNPCSGDGYRVPNMRELLIFMSRIGGDLSDRWLDMYGGWTYNFYQPHILSNTSFSMKNIRPYSGQGRQGYSYNSKENSMGPGANTGYTCGVRDVR